MKQLIDSLEALIKNPAQGLPEDVFLFISRITPIINVDLLIKDKKKGTLLTWREDGLYPPCWHIPGGIIRFKETVADRIHAVAEGELGAKVTFRKEPLAINEVIHPSRAVRGHFISLLFECSLTAPLDEKRRQRGAKPRPGDWAWHEKCPENIIRAHEMYRGVI